MSDFSPLLFCFIGPGASGKNTICDALIKSDLPVTYSISSTTRQAREYEVDGKNYYFLSQDQFRKSIEQGKFLEFAEFAGNLYGTGISNLERASKERRHLVLDIDIQGVRFIKSKCPSNTVVIFVCPSRLSVLLDRFRKRGSDNEARINQRMELAKKEIEEGLSGGFSDYVIVNDDLKDSIIKATAIIQAESIRRNRLNFYPRD